MTPSTKKTIPRIKKDRKKTLTKRQYEKNKTEIINSIEKAITIAKTTENASTTTSQKLANIQHAVQQTTKKYERIPKPRRQTWCTPQFKREIKKQHELHKRRKHNPTEYNIRAHTQHRQQLRKSITKAKKLEIREKLDKASNDPKEQAKILKQLLPRNKQQRTSPTTLIYENKTYTKPEDIANALNDHYITIGHKTSQTIPARQEECITQETNVTYPPFELKHVTNEEVEEVMKKIKRDKASDIYDIKPTIVKDLIPFLYPLLTTEFNNAIDEDEYPESLKITKAIELYKAKDTRFPKNSALSLFSP